MARGALLAVVVLLLAGCAGPGPGVAPEGAGLATAVITAAHPLAAEAGAQMLRGGGNFVDAAAAVQWALNVVEPPMSGLGGGSLLLLWFNETKRLVFLDGRETAPAASTRDQFLLPNGQAQPYAVAHTRGYAVGVPGTLRVFANALDTYGTRSLAQTLEPAIRLAEDGWPVDAYLAGYIVGSEQKLRSWPETARTFFPGAQCPPDPLLPASGNVGCAGGTPLAAGSMFRQPKLAATFRLIAEEGPQVFYEGPIARAIVDAAAVRQGRMTLADLRSYEAKERDVLVEPFGGVHVASASPPTAGGLTMLEILKILDPLDLAAHGSGSAQSLHLMIEAMHLAYADRYAYIGDTDFVRVPMKGLLHDDFIAERRALIDPLRAASRVAPGDPWKYEDGPRGEAASTSGPEPGEHTTHFTIIDGRGNIAAVTTTIESGFGTGMIVPGYGFLLNNQLTDFDFVPGGPNEVAPGKRPRSSMTPTIVLRDGSPVLALGSPGGPTITTTVLQVLLNVIEHGQRVADAVATPRIFSSDPPTVRWESGISANVRSDLASRGHEMASAPARIGNVQAIQVDASGAWTGVADTRAAQGGVVYVRPSEVVAAG